MQGFTPSTAALRALAAGAVDATHHDDGPPCDTVAEAEAKRPARLIILWPETTGSRRNRRTRFEITVSGDPVGYVEAETSDAVRGVMLRGEPFGRYGSRICDHSIETLVASRSERLRLCETIRRHVATGTE